MTFPEFYRKQVLETIQTIDTEKVQRAIGIMTEARDRGRHIFICGNGGSSSTASHFATDMLKGASYGREPRFKILCLAESIPTLTAYSNDVDYECVFVEQLKNFAGPGDVLIAVSGSGNSMNVVRAAEYANSIGCTTITLTGMDGGRLAPLGQLSIQICHPHMGRIEDAHMVVLHMIGYYFMEGVDRTGGAHDAFE